MLRMMFFCSFGALSAMAAGAPAQTFQIAGKFSPGYNLPCVTAGDLNGDGVADVALGDFGGATIETRLGTGAFGFAGPVYAATTGSPTWVTLCDMDGDGRLDALVAEVGAAVGLLPGGAGGFGAETPTPVICSFPAQIAVADLNLDGMPDFAVTDSSAGVVRVALSTAPGTFATSSYAVSPHCTGIVAARLGPDLYPSLVVGSAGPLSQLMILKATPSGVLNVTTLATPFTIPQSLAISDFDEDGRVDVFATNASIAAASSTLFFGDGADGFGSSATIPFAIARDAAVADFNFDGRVDVAVTCTAGLSVAGGNGDGSFLPATSTAVPANAYAIAAADLDGDGRFDVLTTSGNATTLVTILQNTTPLPAFTAAFGTGTAGCWGYCGIASRGAPHVNNAQFGFVASNVPRGSLGLCLIGNQAIPGFADPFGLGAWLHVDLLASTEIYTGDFRSDGGGTAFIGAAIPNSPALIASTYFVQGLWVENAAAGLACSTSPFHIITTRGLALTIQP